MTFLSQRVHAICWTKIKALIKMKRNRKWKIPHIVLERRNLFFSSRKNRKSKVKLWWVGARERKKRAFLYRFFFLPKGNFFKICILSQCIVYWTHFQNIHTFTYQKTLLHTTLLLISKIVERLQCILKSYFCAKRLTNFSFIQKGYFWSCVHCFDNL